ncbi:MAG: PEGA domain-containing protein, partial [Kofleriaceae bacterium]|nr:PEGA domain-containing protein [Kofleriaceae bacterium]
KIEIQGVVVIVSEPAGFDIYLDDPEGKPFAKTPWNGTLSGTHTVYVQRKGYKSGERKIEPKADKFETIVFVLGEEDYLGYLEVTSNIPGASIYMDDKSIGAIAKTPWSDEVKPGKYTLWITKEGYSEYKTEVEIIPGETTKIKAELEGAEVGYLNVRGTGVENVSVYVDGKLLCERGPCLKPLDPGKHTVSIRRGNHKSYNRTIEIQSKTEVTMRADLAKKPSRVDAYVAYLFSAAFVGGGYYLGTKAQDLEDELRADIAAGNPPPDNNDSRFGFGSDTGKTYAIAANVGYVLGGASFLMAVYYTFRDKGKSSTGSVDIRAISFEPQITPTYSGFGLAGRF